MQTVPKKKKLIVLGAFLTYSLSFLIYPEIMAKSGFHANKGSTDLFAILTAGAIILSAYGLLMPWLIQFLIRRGHLVDRMKSETTILVFSYLFLISPAIYGLILLNNGLPLSNFYYFLATSIVGGLAWGLYNLRSTA